MDLFLTDPTQEPTKTTDTVDVPGSIPPIQCKHCEDGAGHCVFMRSFWGCCHCKRRYE